MGRTQVVFVKEALDGVSCSLSPDHHFYEESKPFTCLDGTATIPFDQVNDDYCDCKDGSDEPGESCLRSLAALCLFLETQPPVAQAGLEYTV